VNSLVRRFEPSDGAYLPDTCIFTYSQGGANCFSRAHAHVQGEDGKEPRQEEQCDESLRLFLIPALAAGLAFNASAQQADSNCCNTLTRLYQRMYPVQEGLSASDVTLPSGQALHTAATSGRCRRGKRGVCKSGRSLSSAWCPKSRASIAPCP
jgi:hypothetical protein